VVVCGFNLMVISGEYCMNKKVNREKGNAKSIVS
jgi:hypothetical protein